MLTVPQVEPRHENMCGASGWNYRFLKAWGKGMGSGDGKKKNNFKSVEQREPVCLHRHHLLRISLRQKSVRLTEETACNSKTRLSPRIRSANFSSGSITRDCPQLDWNSLAACLLYAVWIFKITYVIVIINKSLHFYAPGGDVLWLLFIVFSSTEKPCFFMNETCSIYTYSRLNIIDYIEQPDLPAGNILPPLSKAWL